MNNLKPLLLFFTSVVCSLSTQQYTWKRIKNLKVSFSRLLASKSYSKEQHALISYWEDRDGEHSYLEDVLGDDALNWVKEQNNDSLNKLGDPKLDPMYDRILSILDDKDKIPYIRKIGDYYYNFWQDDKNPRGIWRRITWNDYKSSSVNKKWEIIIDFDALGKEEGESWVYKGHTICDLETKNPTRTLMRLSRGGADATVVREFDISTKKFVKEADGGFYIPEAKSRVSWLNPNTLLVGTDFGGNGKALTDSGYPRTVHQWERGTQLEDSPQVYEGAKSDVATSAYYIKHDGYGIEWRCRSITFYTSNYSIRLDGDSTWYDLSKLNLPDDADVSQFKDQILISLRSNWLDYDGGSLLSCDAKEFVTKGSKSKITCIFKPTSKVSLLSYTALKDRLLIHTLENVMSRVAIWFFVNKNWVLEDQERNPVCRGASLSAIDSDASDEFWVTTSSFITPSRMSRADASKGISSMHQAIESPIKSLKSFFKNDDLEEIQAEAISSDGTIVPYFIIRKKNLKSSVPTLLYGYGGFEIPITPQYASTIGASWLEQGYAYVIANIRGGGEFGPSWHQAALKENRNKAYEDFIAVAESLISTGVTSKEKLAIRGGSNGGLLVGNMLTMRPDLWSAVICQVPLLDMKRFSHLLAGASWMAEYGNPDTSDWWDFLRKYSPYHNIDYKHACKIYPPLLMLTSTRDDRVHPYHARSFVKRLNEVNAPEVYYYENIEGGHGGAADSKQQAFISLMYINFLKKIICV